MVNAAELLRRPGSERDLSCEVALDDLDVHDERFEPEQPVTVALHLESLSDGIVVRGDVALRWHGICRRCLREVAGITRADVHELYQQVVTDPDAFPIVGDQLDLAPMVREHALLAAPDGPLCRPDCAGLCPHCGVDRNERSCGCAVEVRDDRWSALDALRQSLADTDEPDEWSSGV